MFSRFLKEPFYYEVLFVCCFGFLCANLVNTFFSSRIEAYTPAAPVSGMRSGSALKPHDVAYYQKVFSDNIFHSGALSASSPLLKRVVAPPPASDIPLRLVGTVVGVGVESMAVIEDLSSHHQQMYGLGDALPGGVVLRTVEDYQVIIERNGRLERLTMDLLDEKKADTRPQSNRGHYSQIFDRAFVSAQLADIGTLMTQARVDVDSIGAEKGLRLSEIAPGSIFKEAGLQNGDFITKVNGQAVTSMDEAYRLMQKMQNINTLEIDMIRGKERRHHSYRIQ